MTLKKINPTKTKSWKKLNAHFDEIKNKKIKSLLEERNTSGQLNLCIWFSLEHLISE